MQYSLRFIIPLVAVAAACSDPASVSTAPHDANAARGGRSPAATAVSGTTVIMSGLNSPRGLAFGPEGALYVAEAGSAAITGPCAEAERGISCYSGTGSITRYWKGRQERVITGLPSVFDPGTGDIAGPHDVSFQGRGNGYITIGLGAHPELRDGLGAGGGMMGSLLRFNPGGKVSVVADVSAYELANNPAGGPVDSNPYGMLAEPSQQFVADAGGNSLLHVSANGVVSLVAAFGAMPTGAEPVPTEVVRGPDGALYVSTLTGFPFVPGSAVIYRVVAGREPEVFLSGFSFITDFAFGPDGSVYVVQFGTQPFLGQPGALVRVAPDGTRTVLADDLEAPTGVVVGPDGAVYVSNRGPAPVVGQVLRIVP